MSDDERERQVEAEGALNDGVAKLASFIQELCEREPSLWRHDGSRESRARGWAEAISTEAQGARRAAWRR